MTGVKRPYHSPVRAEQAATTRTRIGAAAAAQFAEHGWAGTTVAAIAAAAGLTPQAVHLAVGGKAALFIRALETAIAGAGDDVPLAERPGFVDVYAPGVSVHRRLGAFAAASAEAYDRAGRLFLVLPEAARADETLARLAEEGAERRLSDHRRLARLLCPDAGRRELERLTDTIWVLAGPGVYVDFVHRRGWADADYQNFLARALADAVRHARRGRR